MIIGREKERKELQDAYEAEESKFVAVYGRRRVGKTYLVRQTFKGMMLFAHSGQAKGTLSEQLYGWKSSLADAGYKVSESPKSWLEAFDMLKDLIRQAPAGKKVIFIDELPCSSIAESELFLKIVIEIYIASIKFVFNSTVFRRSF